MTTAISKADDQFGNKYEIKGIVERIKFMVPGAASAPDSVVWTAAQLAVVLNLDPFNGEIYVMQTGYSKDGPVWQAHIGVKGLRKKAREQADFMTEFRKLDDAEVKTLRREDYEKGDIGYECILYRLDTARKARDAGLEYRPVRAIGLYRMRAQYHKKDQVWMPDNVPNTWTPEHVAKKRAEINAIKEAFDITLTIADPSREQVIDDVSYRVMQHGRDHSMIVDQERVEADDNGDMLFAVE